MAYEYTSRNRLDEPHSYMYADFKGVDLVRSYMADRLVRLGSLAQPDIAPRNPLEASTFLELQDFLVRQGDCSLVDVDFSGCRSKKNDLRDARPQCDFTLDESVVTVTLLEFILYELTTQPKRLVEESEAKLWLNRLVQRFEVSKKLWSLYLPGFRKGEGTELDVTVYCKFSLLLALACVRSEDLQYLSTLLKVNDLLLSLPEESYANGTSCAIAISVAVELCAVQELMQTKKAANESSI